MMTGGASVSTSTEPRCGPEVEAMAPAARLVPGPGVDYFVGVGGIEELVE